MIVTEIKKQVRAFNKAVEAEKAAKLAQREIRNALKDELHEKMQNIQALMLPKEIECINHANRGVKVFGLKFDTSYKTLFPEGRVMWLTHVDGDTETSVKFLPDEVEVTAKILTYIENNITIID